MGGRKEPLILLFEAKFGFRLSTLSYPRQSWVSAVLNPWTESTKALLNVPISSDPAYTGSLEGELIRIFTRLDTQIVSFSEKVSLSSLATPLGCFLVQVPSKLTLLSAIS